MSEATGRIGEQGRGVGTEMHKHREPPGLQSDQPVLDCSGPAGGAGEGTRCAKERPFVSVPDRSTRFLSVVSFYPHSLMSRLLAFLLQFQRGKLVK